MSSCRLALAVLLVGTVTPALAASKLVALTGDQLKSEYVGKTWHTAWSSGKKHNTGTKTLASDGTATLAMADGFKDTGTWTIEGNKLCEKWKTGNGGCSPIYRKSEGTYLWKGTGKQKGQQTVFSP